MKVIDDVEKLSEEEIINLASEQAKERKENKVKEMANKKEYKKLEDDIEKLMEWMRISIKNGVFYKQNTISQQEIYHELDSAHDLLKNLKFIECKSRLYTAHNLYKEAIDKTPRWWRFLKTEGGIAWIGFAYILLIVIYLTYELNIDISRSGEYTFKSPLLNSLYFAIIGSIIIGLFSLNNKVRKKKHTKKDDLSCLYIPLIGSIIGLVVYLIIIIGLAVLSDAGKVNPISIIPIAFFSGIIFTHKILKNVERPP